MSNNDFWCRHGNIMLTGEHCGACAAGVEPMGEDLYPLERPTDARPWIPDLSAEALANNGSSAEALANNGSSAEALAKAER